MKTVYESPEAELVVLRPNTAIAVIPGTDDKLSAVNEDNLDSDSMSDEGGTGTIPGNRFPR